MTPAQRIDNWSDWLSPMVVKEVRQMVRGREFNYSFALSVLIGLVAAFFGGMEALAGAVGAGAGIFVGLMTCLTLIGIAVVPVGTLNALRVERSERTLDLITVTALSPRKIVIGKLLSQAVKLLTLFAGLAPFMAMSFLLGGIDFLTIILSLTTLFIWSLWACSAALVLSSLTKSRGLSIAVSAVAALVFLVIAGLGRSIYYAALYSGYGVAGSLGFMTGFHGPDDGWRFAAMVAICLTSMANLILLSENRLSPPTFDSVTPLRIGFLAQFLVILGMIVASMPSAGGAASGAAPLVTLLGVFAGLQLAAVATFTVSEELTPRHRVRSLKKSEWEWTMVLLRPGGGRGAAYVLVQMILLLGVGKYLAPPDSDFNWLIATCGYICFFTGVPALIAQGLSPKFFPPPYTRVAILLFFSGLSLIAEIMHYAGTGSNEAISVYHVLSPFRALANWNPVENNHWDSYVFTLGFFGLLSYFGLVHLARNYSRDGYKH